jgi:hypothetical protein
VQQAQRRDLRKQDSITIIEKFYESPLTDEEIKLVPDRHAKLSPARLRVLLERHRKERSSLLDELKNSYPPQNL